MATAEGRVPRDPRLLRKLLRPAVFSAGVGAGLLAFAVSASASANYGDPSGIHWESGYRQNIPVYNRANEVTVAQSIADWNASAGGLVSYDPNQIMGGDPHDCDPVEHAVVICIPTDGEQNGSAVYAGSSYLAWCVVHLPPGWDDSLPATEHEMGHCLGLPHNGDGVSGPFGGWDGGIMGAEEKITQVDHDALARLYGQQDPPTPAPSAGPSFVPGPNAAFGRTPSAQTQPSAATTAPRSQPAPTPSWFGYSCSDASNVTTTSADVGAISNDPTVSSYWITVAHGATVVARLYTPSLARATVTGLSPGTDYAFAVAFEPGDHLQQGQACTFTTPADATGPATPVPPPTTLSPEPPSAMPSTSAPVAPASAPSPALGPPTPNGGLGWGYSCAAATEVTPTSAVVGAVTNDPGASAVITLTHGGGPPQTLTISGYPLRTTASGLTPSTTYTYTATFEPGDHLQPGQPCTFTTPANATASAATIHPPPPSPVPPAPAAAAQPQTAQPPTASAPAPASSSQCRLIRLGPLCL